MQVTLSRHIYALKLKTILTYWLLFSGTFKTEHRQFTLCLSSDD